MIGLKLKKKVVSIEVNLEITNNKFWSTRSQKGYITDFTKFYRHSIII